VNWKCRLFKHKLGDKVGLNLYACARCGTVNRVDAFRGWRKVIEWSTCYESPQIGAE